jgi:hypothetical protein
MNACFRLLLLALLLVIASPAPAAANYQDRWWRPSESGWGVMVLQQGDVISAVMFHYGADRKPVWYLLSSAPRGGNESFTGTLFETSGPALFGAFDPTAVTVREVGTMALSFNSLTAGTVSYTIDGQNASKVIERITFQTPALIAEYLGSYAGYASCPGFPDIDTFTFTSRIIIGGTEPAPVLRVQTGGSLLGEALTCDLTGPLTQSGGIFTGNGTWVCRNASNQSRMTASYTIDEMRIIDKTVVINLRASTSYPSVNANCTERGAFSGVRR